MDSIRYSADASVKEPEKFSGEVQRNRNGFIQAKDVFGKESDRENRRVFMNKKSSICIRLDGQKKRPVEQYEAVERKRSLQTGLDLSFLILAVLL